MDLYALSEVRDQEIIRDFLREDVDYASYALADLHPPYSVDARWIAASTDGSIEALGLIYTGLDIPLLFLMGDAPAINALMMHGIGPEHVYITGQLEHVDALETFYNIEFRQNMFRMKITGGLLTTPPAVANTTYHPVSLTPENLDEIKGLIKECAAYDERDWGDVAFSETMVKDGAYYGVIDNTRLIAVGGTHITSRAESVAALGNVVVHPDYRRQGLGTVISHRVTQHLIEELFDLIVLNVNQKNQAALKTYKRLGYRNVCPFVECLGTRLI